MRRGRFLAILTMDRKGGLNVPVSGFDWAVFWLVKAENLFDFLTSPTGVVWTVIVVGVGIIGLLIIRR